MHYGAAHRFNGRGGASILTRACTETPGVTGLTAWPSVEHSLEIRHETGHGHHQALLRSSVGLQVHLDDELAGLDRVDCGMAAYPEFAPAGGDSNVAMA